MRVGRSVLSRDKGSLCSSREAPAPRSLPTIVSRDCFGQTGGTFCRRRKSWMRIGPCCCGTESRGQRGSGTGGRASCQAGSTSSRI
jgi:hypothetical protein